MEQESNTPDASDRPGPPLPNNRELADRRELIAHHMAALEDLIDPHGRSDGWTPAARMGFLRLVAEHGRVSQACHCVGLSKQSAYSLRARDPLFAIGWDAACQLARMPLADSLYEQCVDGLTDTITRDDGRTVTRHRIDTRLSIAVLNRLDRRCDQAAQTGSDHLGAIAHWDKFVAAIGSDDPLAAQAIIDAHASARSQEGETVKLSQPSQLRPNDDDPDEEEEVLPDPRIWWESGRNAYRTNFPPPEGQYCHENEQFGHRDYHRSLTDAEAATMAARDDAQAAERRAVDEAERDAFFAGLGDDASPCPSPCGEVSESAGGGATKVPTNPPKPPKSEPPPRPDRSERGASNQGESP